MKKIAALLLALCLICPAALATEITGSGEKQAETIIRTEVAQSYTVIIPPEVVIPFEQEETPLTIQVTEMHLQAAQDPAKVNRLKVTVEPRKGTLKNSVNAALTIPYAIGTAEGGDLFFGETGKQDMTVRIAQSDWNRAAAGEYADTITFTVTIAETAK